MAKISIQIVTWNSKRYIFDCLESILSQSFRDFSVVVIDNASSDGTVSFIRSNYPTVTVLQNFRNLGFSKAENQGVMLARGEYVLVINPDVILSPEFLEEIVYFADKHPEGGSFGGKMLKLYSQAIDMFDQSGLREAVRSETLDSTGLEIYKSRLVVDRGQGQKDTGQYERAEEVFGISGAGVIYRRSALDDAAVRNEFFDQNFFAYKEDIDLAWRLRLYGWEAWYTPDAICYHHRGLSGGGKKIKKIVSHRKAVSRSLRALSFRNHHLMLVKNDEWLNILLTLPWFLGRELKIIFYALFFEPFQYRSIVEFFKLLPATLSKRRVIMDKKKTQPREIRRWFR